MNKKHLPWAGFLVSVPSVTLFLQLFFSFKKFNALFCCFTEEGRVQNNEKLRYVLHVMQRSILICLLLAQRSEKIGFVRLGFNILRLVKKLFICFVYISNIDLPDNIYNWKPVGLTTLLLNENHI